MARKKANQRLRAPFMYAFRAAAEARDAKRTVDLRDAEGQRVIASRRAAGAHRRALSDQRLRELLSYDVASLLNCINMESSEWEALSGLDHVKRSILNYGLPDLSNRTIDESRVADIRFELEEALTRYEPRLIHETMTVERDEDLEDDLTIRFIVRSDMRADPMPTTVEFITDVELDTGDIKVDRR